MGCKLVVKSGKHTLVLFVRVQSRLQALEFALVHVVQVGFLQKWIWSLTIRLESLLDTFLKLVFNLLLGNFFA